MIKAIINKVEEIAISTTSSYLKHNTIVQQGETVKISTDVNYHNKDKVWTIDVSATHRCKDVRELEVRVINALSMRGLGNMNYCINYKVEPKE